MREKAPDDRLRSEVLDAPGEAAQRLVVLQIADVVTEIGMIIAAKTKCVFKLGPAGKNHFSEFKIHAYGRGGISARSPDRHFAKLGPRGDSKNRIVCSHMNTAVVR